MPHPDPLPPHPKIRATIDKVSRHLNISSEEVTLLDKGGQSIVFTVPWHSQRALLKIPHYSQRPDEDHWILEHAVRKEGRILAALDTPAAPRLFLHDPGGCYLVREFVPGLDIADYYRDLHPSIGETRRLLSCLAETAARLFVLFHTGPAGCFVLRDFKPKNLVWNDREGYLKAIDFGSVCREADMRSVDPGRRRLGSGKWLYWAPEQLLEMEDICRRQIDYFAFGSSVFFVLTGRAPYSNSETVRNRVLAAYHEEYSRIVPELESRGRQVGICDSAVQFTTRCLHPDPERRPAVFGAEALEAFRLGSHDNHAIR